MHLGCMDLSNYRVSRNFTPGSHLFDGYPLVENRHFQVSHLHYHFTMQVLQVILMKSYETPSSGHLHGQGRKGRSDLEAAIAMFQI